MYKHEDVPDAIEVIDTAYLTTLARAVESTRPDALIVDHLATRFIDYARVPRSRLVSLLGDSGDLIVLRSFMLDEIITALAVDQGVRDLINLGAGFDTRPYRMSFPNNFRIVEIDDPVTIRCKEKVLADQTAAARLERYAFDVTNPGWFDTLLKQVPDIDAAAVMAEGLFTYLDGCAVRALTEELAASGRCRYLIGDLVSPYTARRLRAATHHDGSELSFHAMEDLQAFEAAGWRCIDYRPIGVAVRQHRPYSPIARMMFSMAVGKDGGGLVDGIAVFEHP